jgi:hypothetical protein
MEKIGPAQMNNEWVGLERMKEMDLVSDMTFMGAKYDLNKTSIHTS